MRWSSNSTQSPAHECSLYIRSMSSAYLHTSEYLYHSHDPFPVVPRLAVNMHAATTVCCHRRHRSRGTPQAGLALAPAPAPARALGSGLLSAFCCRYLNPAQAEDTSQFHDKESATELEIIEKQLMVEWIAEHYKEVRKRLRSTVVFCKFRSLVP